MIKLLVLIIIAIAFFIGAVVTIVVAIVKKRKGGYWLSAILFMCWGAVSFYTLYYGVWKGTEKAFQMAGNVFPTFDSDQPDTDANKKNFKAFLKVEVTPDVKNIYCFDDAIGIDADYMFSFNCDTSTVAQIILRNELKKDTILGGNEDGLQHDFDWWDKERIKMLPRYSWDTEGDATKKTGNNHKRFWYDEVNQKAYYFEFDL